jgi:peptide chain release factor 2
VSARTERYQEQNRKYALAILRAKLWTLEQEKMAREKQEISGEYTPATWGTQIRSYVLHPYKMIKDLRTNVETSNTDAVLAGALDEFIEAEIALEK